ncbi:putative two component system sensor kinase [Streptomyces ambofaciens ATCC 23877]|uniref:histidine kinase n=1 Tax=Streptomyces ambofaciens (strain ATCC 23877 / 3486 / DSM 40053 / JCM 4204 / NBRC 12836 / NRRL B-2516) TaxID=278992 RepID=A3KK14_STRA7|nr:putative two component system sensor kinase [Streptomyces ambofaciens ATCC 23877]CAJ90049.1 putative two component system sensor kinase [Streptomyces ambofaciens ATCC 23877]
MDVRRGRGAGSPRWWRYGPPWWDRRGAAEPRPRWPWRSTVLLTAFMLVGSTFAAHGQEGERVALDPPARVLLLLTGAALLWRQRYPVPVVFGTVGATLVYLCAGYPYGPVFVAVAVACFSAVVAGRRREAWAAMAAMWAASALLSHWLYRWLPPPGDAAASWGQEIVIATWVVAIVALSELARARREQWARERAERARAAERRADEERLRIARELHDVLAHSISVINVQAGVGLALLDADPEQARTALTTIKAQSKEALGEVRQVLDTLRAPGDAPRAPAPGLDRLSELVEQAAGAGLTVEVEGKPPRLSPGTDLAAFRIVQEALTNVVRHSGSRRARVCLGRDGGTLRLRVDDDGPATGAEAGGSGNGLAGMRERAAALGGTIEAGPRPDGGFRVRATLPIDVRPAGDATLAHERKPAEEVRPADETRPAHETPPAEDVTPPHDAVRAHDALPAHEPARAHDTPPVHDAPHPPHVKRVEDAPEEDAPEEDAPEEDTPVENAKEEDR